MKQKQILRLPNKFHAKKRGCQNFTRTSPRTCHDLTGALPTKRGFWGWFSYIWWCFVWRPAIFEWNRIQKLQVGNNPGALSNRLQTSFAFPYLCLLLLKLLLLLFSKINCFMWKNFNCKNCNCSTLVYVIDAQEEDYGDALPKLVETISAGTCGVFSIILVDI